VVPLEDRIAGPCSCFKVEHAFARDSRHQLTIGRQRSDRQSIINPSKPRRQWWKRIRVSQIHE